MTQIERIFEIHPPRLRVRKKDVETLLEPAAAGLLATAKRRGDCASLGACEDRWFTWHGEAQAKCPTRCPKYHREAASARRAS